MKKWNTPIITVICARDIEKAIRARAWSVGSAMDLGALYDQGNMEYNGLIMLPEYGYEIQAQVVGYICLAGYFVYEVTIGAMKKYYRQASNNTWYETTF